MKIAAYFILFFCCFAGIYALNHPGWKTNTCEEYGLQKDARYEGVIINKWADSLNNSCPMLRVKLGGEQGGFTRDLNLLADTGRFYQLVVIGDSVEKKEGMLEVLVKRNGKTFAVTLQPDCN
jgi:hypothetical protein